MKQVHILKSIQINKCHLFHSLHFTGTMKVLGQHRAGLQLNPGKHRNPAMPTIAFNGLHISQSHHVVI